MKPHNRIEVLRVLGVMVAFLLLPATGSAGVYPGNKCVSTKMKLAGKYCQGLLNAWSKWDIKQDNTARDEAVLAAGETLAAKWAAAEATAAKKQVQCDETTQSLSALQTTIDTTVGDIVTAINGGLDLGNADDAKCGAKLLSAAAKKCAAFLKAEAKYIVKLDKDPQGTARDAAKDAAGNAFEATWQEVIAGGCPTTASQNAVEEEIDSLTEDVVLGMIFSPNVDDTQFTTIAATGPIKYLNYNLNPTCIKGAPYYFFAKRGMENKLVMYYQGGGACWEQLTCGIPVCDQAVDPNGTDNPNNWTHGFANLDDPNNPFEDWNIVVVPYCSCDIHFGDIAQDYGNVDPGNPVHIEHRGFQNAKAAEKWAREHFVNPEVVFVTGTSAGAYGAVFQAPLLHKVWPASKFHVLGDAGNGVITTQFLQNEFENWNFRANLPRDIPGVLEAIDTGTGMVGYIDAVAARFPNTNWAHYTTAFDGGSGGQTGFYNVMLNGNNPAAALTWWEGSCAFNAQMYQQATDTVALVAAKNNNYRYYIGSGSRHGMWGHDKVYTDTTGGVPTIVDWITEMLTNGTGWVNVEASPFNVLLPGDPAPSPLQPPFQQSGSDIVVNCP